MAPSPDQRQQQLKIGLADNSHLDPRASWSCRCRWSSASAADHPSSGGRGRERAAARPGQATIPPRRCGGQVRVRLAAAAVAGRPAASPPRRVVSAGCERRWACCTARPTRPTSSRARPRAVVESRSARLGAVLLLDNGEWKSQAQQRRCTSPRRTGCRAAAFLDRLLREKKTFWLVPRRHQGRGQPARHQGGGGGSHPRPGRRGDRRLYGRSASAAAGGLSPAADRTGGDAGRAAGRRICGGAGARSRGEAALSSKVNTSSSSRRTSPASCSPEPELLKGPRRRGDAAVRRHPRLQPHQCEPRADVDVEWIRHVMQCCRVRCWRTRRRGELHRRRV